MKTFFILILALCLTGCTTIYDSRGQNAGSLGEGNYEVSTAKDLKVKTGRVFCFSTYQKGCNQYFKK